ncbi:glycoside hydrolase domain-containing protein [Flavobacterium sp. LT1R49]|uniref:glycoside hydrolase domain-containing protein n=1 Tax=Flavobacterium arabinosi TaxID=3398737 RepID=UPI003A87AB51
MKINRTFLCLPLCFVLFYNCTKEDKPTENPILGTNAPACQTPNESDSTYRTFFKPSVGWVGDPIPFYENGIFHLFYLYDARNTMPTFHPWYKVTTSDFGTFTDTSEMIATGTANQQDGALGTGSVFKRNGVYYAFYTGHNGNLDPKEKIMLATSMDLKNWTKDPSFLLQASFGYDRNEFRDPIVIEDKITGKYKMLIATRSEVGLVSNSTVPWRAVIAQYSSTNLRDWTLEKPLYEDTTTFITECPDVFTMGDYQYLVYSNIDDRMVHYKYRLLTANTWITPVNSKLDGIAFYAGKTVTDGINRYIAGWCPTKNKNSDATIFDWAGSLVTHRLVQHPNGTLGIAIPNGVDSKFIVNEALNATIGFGTTKQGDAYTLKGNAAGKAFSVFERKVGAFKIKAHIKATSSTQFGFEFGACETRNEVFAIVFDLAKNQLRLDKVIKNASSLNVTQLPLNVPANKEFDITIISENSVCVIYINDEIAFTNRIYKMNQNPWAIFADNGEVTFSDLKIFK